MFVDRLRALIDGVAAGTDTRADATAPDEAQTAAPDALQLAACALLLDIAYADGEYTTGERVHIERSLELHFALPPDAAQKIIALAEEERAKAVDHFAFTSTLLRGYDTAQKMVLAEVMWGVVLADGKVADHEHYLTRKISNLLNLEPGYLSSAKRAAESGIASPEAPSTDQGQET